MRRFAQPGDKRTMLVEHLLTHTSGLSYGFLRKCKAAVLYRKTIFVAPRARLSR